MRVGYGFGRTLDAPRTIVQRRRFAVARRAFCREGLTIRVGVAAFSRDWTVFYSELNMEITFADDSECFPM
jgi:hypothetical protein